MTGTQGERGAISVGPRPGPKPARPQKFPGKPDPTKPGKRPAKGDPAYNPDVNHPPKAPNRLPQR